MINIPNAAGFIPSESVIDGIAKLYNMFSPEAKAKRQADLAYTQAQTGHVGAETTAVPQRTAQGWGQVANDTTRAANDTTRAGTGVRQQLSEENLGLGHLNVDQQRADEERHRDVIRQGEEAQRFQQQAEEFRQNLGMKQLELGGNMKEQAARTGLYGAQTQHVGDEATHLRNEDMTRRGQLLMNMAQWEGSNPDYARLLKQEAYKNVAPELLPAIQQQEKFAREMAESQRQRAGTVKSAPRANPNIPPGKKKGPIKPWSEPQLPGEGQYDDLGLPILPLQD